MKRLICVFSALVLCIFLSVITCEAEESVDFGAEIEQIENSVDDDVREGLSSVNGDSVKKILSGGVRTESVLQYLAQQLNDESKGPLAAVTVLVSVLILASVAESYTCSLRYTDTKDIMSTVVSLFVVSVVISPITQLITSSASVMKGASTLITGYLPVMAGILLFSGHTISSGGYYTAVVAVSQLIARIASGILVPLLNAFLSLSVCSGICSGIRLGGMIEIISKCFKYSITFLMSIFIAVIGLNSALSGAADSVTNRAAKFSLSSFIPLIGSSIAEAYGAIQNSMNVLRAGVGVFVILAIFLSFLPVLVRIFLWSAVLFIAKSVGEALSVSSSQSVLNALSQFLSALRVTIIAVMTVLIISSSVMMSVGGST